MGAHAMGWKDGKKLIIKPAAGERKSFDAEPQHVQGRRLLVDVSGVLHKAVRRGAKQVAMTGTSSDAEEYVAQYIESLLQLGAIPIMVFDGCRYPPKKVTQDSRRKAATEARTEAQRLEQAGKSATKAWKDAASVQEPLLRAVMAYCVRRGIDYIVSPYEADTQLVACLEAGQGDAVLVASDDSDIVALGNDSSSADLPVLHCSTHLASGTLSAGTHSRPATWAPHAQQAFRPFLILFFFPAASPPSGGSLSCSSAMPGGLAGASGAGCATPPRWRSDEGDGIRGRLDPLKRS